MDLWELIKLVHVHCSEKSLEDNKHSKLSIVIILFVNNMWFSLISDSLRIIAMKSD